MVNQIEANIYAQRPNEIEWFKKLGISLMADSPLGHGKLPDLVKEEILTRIGSKYGKTGAQVSIRFLIQLGFTVIPKSSNPGRIKENFDVFDFELTDEEMEEIKSLNRNSPLVGRPDDPNMVIKLIDRDD